MKLGYMPVVIIGAGRSGTNALRDMISSLPNFATWPCDEINPIWRHNNLSWPDDEIPVSRVTPSLKKFIRSEFDKCWKNTGMPDFVVEKTCANSLRVPFVDKILPEARFIHLVRHGNDVVASAAKRWRGEMEIDKTSYFYAKARFVPILDLPYYVYRFIRIRLAKLLGKTDRLSTWGPRFSEMGAMYEAPLEKICAAQWAACVSLAETNLAQVDKSRVLTVLYEDLVSDPEGTLRNILEFLGADPDQVALKSAVTLIRKNPDAFSRNRQPLHVGQEIIEPALRRFYKDVSG